MIFMTSFRMSNSLVIFEQKTDEVINVQIKTSNELVPLEIAGTGSAANDFKFYPIFTGLILLSSFWTTLTRIYTQTINDYFVLCSERLLRIGGHKSFSQPIHAM